MKSVTAEKVFNLLSQKKSGRERPVRIQVDIDNFWEMASSGRGREHSRDETNRKSQPFLQAQVTPLLLGAMVEIFKPERGN